MVLDKL